MKLPITETDIKLAFHNYCGCPIARALNRNFPGGDASVGALRASVGDHFFRLGEDARQFVLDYDSGNKVTPQIVTLEEVDYETWMEMVR